MKTLAEIAEEMGKIWMQKHTKKAQREWECSPYLFSNADAYHSFLYEEIYKDYEKEMKLCKT